MNLQNCACGEKWKDEAYATLRVVTGLMFFVHGYGKFTTGVDTIVGFFGNVGVPFAKLLAYVVTYGEMVTGILLVLGFCTHWASKFGTVVILGAIYFVHLEKGYGAANGGYEYPLLILAACLVLLTHDAGKYSLDNRRKDTAV